MIRIAIFCALFALALSLQVRIFDGGFISERTIDLWAHALLAADAVPFNVTNSFYPPLPRALTLGLGWLPLPAPSVLAALLSALITMTWWSNLRENGGYGWIGATALTVALILNPVFLRAVADGPGMMLLIYGTWIFARGLMGLRLRGSTNDMMKVSFGLVLVVLSHAFGLLLTLAAMPALILAGRPSQVGGHPVSFLVTMLFPVFVAGLSLAIINLTLGLPVVPRIISEPGADVLPSLLALGVVLVPAIAVVRRVWGVARYWMPLLGGMISLVLSVLLNSVFGPLNDPMLAAAPALGLAAVALRFWPFGRDRAVAAASLSIASAIAAAFILFHNPVGARLIEAISGQQYITENASAARKIATLLRDSTGIILDAERSPEIVVASGNTRQLIFDGNIDYELTRRRRTATAAAQNIVLRVGDRLSENLDPGNSGDIPGYRLILAAQDWRVFERTGQ
ncbi:MAG: hypothetical protein WBG95_16055 [Sulfitobacter sp.]